MIIAFKEYNLNWFSFQLFSINLVLLDPTKINILYRQISNLDTSDVSLYEEESLDTECSTSATLTNLPSEASLPSASVAVVSPTRPSLKIKRRNVKDLSTVDEMLINHPKHKADKQLDPNHNFLCDLGLHATAFHRNTNGIEN